MRTKTARPYLTLLMTSAGNSEGKEQDGLVDNAEVSQFHVPAIVLLEHNIAIEGAGHRALCCEVNSSYATTPLLFEQRTY